MSEAEFSKGDWVLVEDVDSCYWYIDIINNKYHDNDHHAIAEIVVKMTTDSSGGEDYDNELKANAFVISKANKMYEMLSDIANDYECQCGHPRCSKELQKKEILQLLAEARGESKDEF